MTIEAGSVTVADDGTVTKSGIAAAIYDAIVAQESVNFPNPDIPSYTFTGTAGAWKERVNAALIKIKQGFARTANAMAKGSPERMSWVEKHWTNTVWTLGVGNFCVGTRWRMKTKRQILGVRLGWADASVPLTLTVRVWNDSSGLSLASASVSVNKTGVYSGIFAAPIETDLTGVDITTSFYETSGQAYAFSSEEAWRTQAPFEWNEDLRMLATTISTGGSDARPLTPTVGGVFLVEPILGAYF